MYIINPNVFSSTNVFFKQIDFFIKSWLGYTLKHDIARMLHLNYYDLESNFVISTTRITFSNKKEIPVRVRRRKRRVMSILNPTRPGGGAPPIGFQR